MTAQMPLVGVEPALRVRALSERQRAVLRHARYLNDRGRGYTLDAARPLYVDPARALRRLVRAGLLERRASEWWAVS